MKLNTLLSQFLLGKQIRVIMVSKSNTGPPLFATHKTFPAMIVSLLVVEVSSYFETVTDASH